MGGKDSKTLFVSYEDAVKRVSDAELKRLKEAFKRTSTIGGFMSRQFFVREVLGDGVPLPLAERMFVAFGGSATRGLSFKDLLAGLVLLTKGDINEKIKFIFGVYASEPTFSYIDKVDMDELVLQSEGHAPPDLADLFCQSDRVGFETFRDWVLTHRDALSMTQWLTSENSAVLMSNDLETPTFYQTLAGVTHLEETDIIELEKQYWQLKGLSRTGRFDLETFTSIVSPPLPQTLCHGLFSAFDENQDNHIDFKELACGVSACGRGPTVERQKFCFKIFDTDHDGLLSRTELCDMLSAMLTVSRMQTPPPLSSSSASPFSVSSPSSFPPSGGREVTVDTLVRDIMTAINATGGGVEGEESGRRGLTQEEYLVWAVNQTLPAELLNLLVQICHIVLGLKPQSKEDEKAVVMPWLIREERNGLKAGQVWYLVAMPWWRQWKDYINFTDMTSSASDPLSSRLSSSATSGISSVGSTVGGRGGGSHSRSGSVVSLCPGGYLRRGSGTVDNSDQISLTAYTSNSTSIGGAVSKSSAYHNGIDVSVTSSDTALVTTTSRSSSQSSTPSGSPGSVRRIMGGMKPGAIDNTGLIVQTNKVLTLTNEGGCLKTDQTLRRDYEIIPEAVWKALSSWYGRSPVALPRTVIIPYPGAAPKLELYPIQVKLLRYQVNNNNMAGAGGGQRNGNNSNVFSGFVGGIGGIVYSAAGMSSGSGGGGVPVAPRRYLAYTAVFSLKHTLKQVYEFLTNRLKIAREDMRLWRVTDESNVELLEEEDRTIEELRIEDNCQILIEVRNKDLTWPEELCQLAKNKVPMDKSGAAERGATGLNNLGNTCFMNSALQCISNTYLLTVYFTSGMHLYELNRSNPLGAHGDIAQRYGDLVKDLWSGTARSIAPLKLRWTIGKYAPCFSGFQQHDSQELLAFVLDRLHEDLNRVHEKPYVELKDSDGRPDEIVAKEAWDNHLVRNQSIIVDLFHGQLKSCVRCIECGHTSVKFDPFTFLSLPLPMESCIHLEIIVVRLDESCPVKYGLRLQMDEKYRGVKVHLSELCGIPVNQLLIVDVFGAVVRGFPSDNAKIKMQQGGSLFAYELPPIAPIPTMSPADEKLLDNTMTSLHNISLNSSAFSTSVNGSTQNGYRSEPPNRSTHIIPLTNHNACNGSGGDCSATVHRYDGRSMAQSHGSAVTFQSTDRMAGNANGPTPVDTRHDMTVTSSTHRTMTTQHQQSGLAKIQRLQSQTNTKQVTVASVSEVTSDTSDDTTSLDDGNHLASDLSTLSSSVVSNGTTLATSLNETTLLTNGAAPYHAEVTRLAGGTSVCNGSAVGRGKEGRGVGGGVPVTSSPGGEVMSRCDYLSNGFVVAMHRKMVHMDVYFLSSLRSRPSLFGTPMVLACDSTTTKQNLYQQVWSLVSRLVSPLPPAECTAAPNHAQDCDDSLGYEYPFTLKIVQPDGFTCTTCPWYRFCRGCTIDCNGDLFNSASSYVAIDWEPTALHLRYHASQEKVYKEHESVEASRVEHTESIGLDGCLKAFTKEEHLGEDELYYCSKCRKHCLAAKKLDLWKLPPIFIIHLKRFQFHNGRWVKSQKIVKFPLKDFDPTNYLVPRAHASSKTSHPSQMDSSSSCQADPTRCNGDCGLKEGGEGRKMSPSMTMQLDREAGLGNNNSNRVDDRNRQLEHSERLQPQLNGLNATGPNGLAILTPAQGVEVQPTRPNGLGAPHILPNGQEATPTLPARPQAPPTRSAPPLLDIQTDPPFPVTVGVNGSDNTKGDDNAEARHANCDRKGRNGADIIELNGSVGNVDVRDGEEGEGKAEVRQEQRRGDDDDYSDVRYNLYAVSCHTGILGGGHYVTYAKNPNQKWYCYNDSSCKEVNEEQVDTDSAYILFYERQGLNKSRYMPDVCGREPQAIESDDEIERDFKKLCAIQ